LPGLEGQTECRLRRGSPLVCFCTVLLHFPNKQLAPFRSSLLHIHEDYDKEEERIVSHCKRHSPLSRALSASTASLGKREALWAGGEGEVCFKVTARAW